MLRTYRQKDKQKDRQTNTTKNTKLHYEAHPIVIYYNKNTPRRQTSLAKVAYYSHIVSMVIQISLKLYHWFLVSLQSYHRNLIKVHSRFVGLWPDFRFYSQHDDLDCYQNLITCSFYHSGLHNFFYIVIHS